MRSKFAVFDHPIHPALVALPIGLFTWAFVAIVVYAFSDENRTWYDISYWSSIAGIASALVAALPGFGDYFTVARHTRDRDIATAHMVLNLGLVALFAVAAVIMYDEGADAGRDLAIVVTLQALGVGLLGLSGWLGGEMVYKGHLAVGPEDGEEEREEQARHVLEHGIRTNRVTRGR